MSLPAISILGASGVETANPSFQILLDQPSSFPVTVSWRLVSGTESKESDYSGSIFADNITFQAGEVSKTLNINYYNDRADELDEFFTIELSNPINATLAGSGRTLTATGIILDDDGPGSNLAVFVTSPQIVEGDSGQREAIFEVMLSRASTVPLAFNFATADLTATAGSDYAATNGALTFAVGETVKVVRVPVFGDTVSEVAETFSLRVAPQSGNPVGPHVGTATILDDEPELSTISIQSASYSENYKAAFFISLSAPSLSPVTVMWRKLPGTALPSLDYDAYDINGTITFAAGEISQTLLVDARSDALDEFDEFLILELSKPNGAVLAGERRGDCSGSPKRSGGDPRRTAACGGGLNCDRTWRSGARVFAIGMASP